MVMVCECVSVCERERFHGFPKPDFDSCVKKMCLFCENNISQLSQLSSLIRTDVRKNEICESNEKGYVIKKVVIGSLLL